MKLLPKQEHAVYYLKDKKTIEILYGGAAGGGKSALGCLWLIECCQKYPGSRWLMGRAKLKSLRETTLNTFFDLSSKLGISDQWRYNAQDFIINWNNGSQIILKDLFLYPSDPNFDSLGSLEITGAFIDECNQIVYQAWQVVKSRIRYRLNEFDLIPKILGSCNPAKNWVYSVFYKPNKINDMPEYRRFVQALPTDNEYLPESYLTSLLQLEKNSRERLYHGNWEYDDNPYALIDYDAISNITYNDWVTGNEYYITADIARLGSDKAVIFVWQGLCVIDYKVFAISKTTEIQIALESFRVKYHISKNNIIADEDGVGGGVVDNCGIVGFVNNSKPFKEEGKDQNYQNLKTQCYYKLAKAINDRALNISCGLSTDELALIQEELEQVESWETDKDGKIKIKPKEEVKKNIGRSPDYSDALAMRFYFELRPTYTGEYTWNPI